MRKRWVPTLGARDLGGVGAAIAVTAFAFYMVLALLAAWVERIATEIPEDPTF